MSNFIFRSMFLSSKGKPVTHKGKTIYLHDYITVGQNTTINAKILSTNSKNKQGFYIQSVQPKNKNSLYVNGIKGDIFTFWEDTFPKEGTEIKILNQSLTIAIWNE